LHEIILNMMLVLLLGLLRRFPLMLRLESLLMRPLVLPEEIQLTFSGVSLGGNLKLLDRFQHRIEASLSM
jgi:hypothetical protein